MIPTTRVATVVLRMAALAALASLNVRAAAFGQSAPAQPQTQSNAAYRNRLLGVYDPLTGNPIEGAEVIDVFGKVTARTTKTGTVTLSFLPDGGSMVRIQKIGFEPKVQMIVISPEDTVPLTVLLTRSVNTLATVVTRDSGTKYTSPGLRGFEERRKTSVGGRFITEDELRKHETEKLTAMVRRFSNLNVLCTRAQPQACYAVSSRLPAKNVFGAGRCDVDVYIDGSIDTDNDLEKLRVDGFAGIEFYAGAANLPSQYNKTGSSCGAILLWSRER